MNRHTSFFCVLAGLSVLVCMPNAVAETVVMEVEHPVRIERHIMITMRDGSRLSADMARPDANGKFPVVFQYDPYRTSNLHIQKYFAARGFIALKVDARGTGGSDGVNTDEYMPIEQQDGYDTVEWLAKQPWSSGNVGMFGASYSGFTALQVATHRPPHLKAIVPMYATDDRYTDDCHYTPGGNMRMYYDVGHYGGWMVLMNAMPPYPEMDRPDWLELWKHRLEHNEPYIPKWMSHQVDGPYWRNGSLRPNYDRIQVPVFLIAGWHDGYPNPMLRMYQHIRSPKKLLMGPWVHIWPHASVPGPRIDWMNEATRFFAHWLRDEDTGIMDEPPLATYMQKYWTPDRTIDHVPGHWRSDAAFPVAGARELVFYMNENGGLGRTPEAAPKKNFGEFEYLATVGLANGYWSGGGIPYYLPGDQRIDEAHSLVFTTPPLEEEIQIFGWPKVILHAASSAEVATFVVKIADVAPDGHSALIVGGSLNGTRRDSYTDPSPMKPGKIYELDVPMWPTGWVLEPGHRLRVAISSSDFPNLWPTPEPARNRIYFDKEYPSRLILPAVPDSTLPPPRFIPFEDPDRPNSPRTLQVIHDQLTGTATVFGDRRIIDKTIAHQGRFRATASSRDPARASMLGTHQRSFTVDDDKFEITAESSIRATRTSFHIIINLNITKNGRTFFHKQWLSTEPRRLL